MRIPTSTLTPHDFTHGQTDVRPTRLHSPRRSPRRKPSLLVDDPSKVLHWDWGYKHDWPLHHLGFAIAAVGTYEPNTESVICLGVVCPIKARITLSTNTNCINELEDEHNICLVHFTETDLLSQSLWHHVWFWAAFNWMQILCPSYFGTNAQGWYQPSLVTELDMICNWWYGYASWVMYGYIATIHRIKAWTLLHMRTPYAPVRTHGLSVQC